jgi:hypothetical protein
MKTLAELKTEKERIEQEIKEATEKRIAELIQELNSLGVPFSGSMSNPSPKHKVFHFHGRNIYDAILEVLPQTKGSFIPMGKVHSEVNNSGFPRQYAYSSIACALSQSVIRRDIQGNEWKVVRTWNGSNYLYRKCRV